MKDYIYIKLGAIFGTLFILAYSYINKTVELSPLILFLTFLAILWYSMETKELKEISEKRPCLSFNRYGEEIILKNYGDGIARSIIISDGDKIFHKVPLISRAGGGFAPLPLNRIMKPEKYSLLKNYQGNIFISYSDQSGNREYITKIKWSDSENCSDGCEIIEHSWK